MIKKVLLSLLIVMFLFTFLSSYTIVKATSISNVMGGADSFINAGDSSNSPISLEAEQNTASFLYNTLLIIGTCAAVIVAAILGIQFMTGSIEQKGKVKESLVPFVIGCVVLFGAFGIWRLVIILIR